MLQLKLPDLMFSTTFLKHLYDFFNITLTETKIAVKCNSNETILNVDDSPGVPDLLFLKSIIMSIKHLQATAACALSLST